MRKKKFTIFEIKVKIMTNTPSTEDDLGEELKKLWENYIAKGVSMKGRLKGLL